MEIPAEYLIDIVDRALTEDIGEGDVTTVAMVDPESRGRAEIIAKHAGIVSGLDLAALVFYRLDQDSEVTTDLVEGSAVFEGETIMVTDAGLPALLTGERTALNFLMHLSGIASLTAKFVKQVAHTPCRILDTRKTSPGLRPLEKRAVSSGGGFNHRIGLFDMILIKNNHIVASGSIEEAVRKATEQCAAHDHKNLKIEIEVRTIDEIHRVVHLPVDRVMLDNFHVNDAAAAVKIIRETKPELEIEASGNMRLDNLRAFAETGVDFISVGALTHSAPWLDMSMKIASVPSGILS